jgi:hypothetical protein
VHDATASGSVRELRRLGLLQFTRRCPRSHTLELVINDVALLDIVRVLRVSECVLHLADRVPTCRKVSGRVSGRDRTISSTAKARAAICIKRPFELTFTMEYCGTVRVT